MNFYKKITVFVLTCAVLPLWSSLHFIADRTELQFYRTTKRTVMIASTGRSGSSMLTEQILRYSPFSNVLKTHILPPDNQFRGKIVFIFSNPDKAAESALYACLHFPEFGPQHCNNMETTDHSWLKSIGGIYKQTPENNLLSYDGLGISRQLEAWLYTRTLPADPREAQIFAVKYEHLWEEATIRALRDFLGIYNFQLPQKITRGQHQTQLLPEEVVFRQLYNLGTQADPRYAAYDEARTLWEQAPPFQYLKLTSSSFQVISRE